MNNFSCGEVCTGEEICGDASYDMEGLVKHQQIGYNYDLGKYQHQTMEFDEGEDGTRKVILNIPKGIQNLEITSRMDTSIVDHTVKGKVFKTKLLGAMKSAVEQQDISGKMGQSDKSRQIRAGKEFANKSVIKKILDTQRRNNETVAAKRTGVHRTNDVGYIKRHSKDHLKNTLQIKSNMIKGSHMEGDVGKLRRNIENSMKLNREDRTKLCATGLTNAGDRGAIMREVVTDHVTGCSEIHTCCSGYKGTSQENSLVDPSAVTQQLKDDLCTQARSSKFLTKNPRSAKVSVAFTDDVLETNISDTSRFEGSRNKW